MRIESARPVASGGWLHSSNGSAPKDVPQLAADYARRSAAIFAESGIPRYREAMAQTRAEDYERYACELGLSADALRSFGPAWDRRCECWLWPMYDTTRRICGIQCRSEDGEKWSIRGSRLGLFLCRDLLGEENPDWPELWVTEGATDAVACLQCGRIALARASAYVGQRHVLPFLAGISVGRLVICADRDDVGIRDGRALARAAEALAEKVELRLPPFGFKDVRELVAHGHDVEEMPVCHCFE